MAQDNQNILEHNINTFGAVTVMDVLFSDANTHEPDFMLDSLKVSNIIGDGKKKKLTGGKLGVTLLTFAYGVEARVEITDAIASMNSLSAKIGATITRDNIKHSTRIQELVVTTEIGAADIDILFTGTPSAGDIDLVADAYQLTDPALESGYLFVYNVTKGTKLEETTDYTFTTDGNFITDITLLTATGSAAGDVIDIYAQNMATSGVNTGSFLPNEILLGDSNVPKTYHLSGDTILIGTDNLKVAGVFEIPRFELDLDFNIALESDGDAAVFNFNGDALYDKKTKSSISFKRIRVIG